MAGIEGFEPSNDGVKVRCLTAWLYPIVLYSDRISAILYCQKKLASPQGFEPRTHGLEGRCSIQLSYEPALLERMMRIELTPSAWKAEVLPLNYIRIKWSGRRDSNSRPSPWQGDALPLSHFRILSWSREMDSNHRKQC